MKTILSLAIILGVLILWMAMIGFLFAILFRITKVKIFRVIATFIYKILEWLLQPFIIDRK